MGRFDKMRVSRAWGSSAIMNPHCICGITYLSPRHSWVIGAQGCKTNMRVWLLLFLLVINCLVSDSEVSVFLPI